VALSLKSHDDDGKEKGKGANLFSSLLVIRSQCQRNKSVPFFCLVKNCQRSNVDPQHVNPKKEGKDDE
jgi:hypothetical protein